MTEVQPGGIGRVAAGPRSLAAFLGAHPWLAIAFIAATATTFALGSTLLRFTYEAGAGALTIVMTRASIAALGLWLLLRLLRVPIRLTPRERWVAPLIGLFITGYSGAMYFAFELMPVALAVLTFYTYPLLTGLFSWLAGKERFSLAGVAALPLAFLGLVLALDVSGGNLSLEGALWSLVAALGFSGVLVLSALLLPQPVDTRPRTFVMLATAAGTGILVATLSGQIWFPTTALGWGSLIASGVLYTGAMTAILFAAAALGAARVALVMNFEPVASMILTFLILGDRLRPMQLVGAALVIAAIFLFRPRRVPSLAEATPPPPR